MGVDFDYRAEGFFSVNDILRIYKIVQVSFEGFIGFSTEELHRAYFEPKGSLPKLYNFKGIRLKSINTDGYLPLKDKSLDIFRDILQMGEMTIGNIGLLLVRCGFEEKSSKQTKRGYDSVSIRIEKGKKYFGYGANGSNVDKDTKYRKEFMARLIRIADLPLKIVEGNDSFRLVHTESGELKTLKSFFGKDPSSFFCEIPGASIDELVDRMQVFLIEFASKKRFVYDWGVLCSGYPDPEISKRIYEMALAANFPAERYFLIVEFSIDDIQGIEIFRNLCGPKDDVYTRLCSFDLPEDNYGEIKIVTTSKGHQLRLTLRTPDNLKLVEKKIGLKFSEA